MKNVLGIVKEISLIFILGLALAGLTPAAAAAQSQTVLFVTPDQVDVPLGNQVKLEVEVLLGLNVNAFDLTLTYDPAVLALAEWQHGDYLSNLANVKVEDEAGHLRVAATQLATPAVSGDGVLLTLYFDSLGEGQTTIHLVDVIFADAQGNKTEPQLVDGEVAVIVAATYTPTPTPTRTPTPKPTITPQPTDGGTGYPVKEDPTATPAIGAVNDPGPETGETDGMVQATESAADLPLVAGGDDGDSGQGGNPGSVPASDAGAAEAAAVEASAAGEEVSESNQATAPNRSTLNGVLWLVLAIAVVVLGGMMVIAVRRPKKRREDYLL